MNIIDDRELLDIYFREGRNILSDLNRRTMKLDSDDWARDAAVSNLMFRAVHTIKGGAAFLGLKSIRPVSSKMEIILNMMRNGEIQSVPSIIQALLAGSSLLLEYFQSSGNVRAESFSEIILQLDEALHEALPRMIRGNLDDMIILGIPGRKPLFSVSEFELRQACTGSRILYIMDMDLSEDVEARGRTIMEHIGHILSLATIIDAKLDTAAMGSLENVNEGMKVPFQVLVATAVPGEKLISLLGLDENGLHRISWGEQN